MDITKHCQICDHRIFDLENGIRCGLTNQKPQFEATCQNAFFDKNLEQDIEDINVKYKLVGQTKALTYANFVVYLVVGFSIIIAGYLVGVHAYNHQVLSTVPLFIMGAGVPVLGLAFGPLNKYRQEMSVAKQNKEELHRLLELYQIEYTIDIKINKDLHGNKDVETEVNLFRKK